MAAIHNSIVNNQWATVEVVGINGRGKKRDGATIATGRVMGADVTNQLLTAPDTK